MLKHKEISISKESYLWIQLNLIDFVLTSIGLVFGAVEVNFAMRHFGINAVLDMVAWKVILVCGVLLFLLRIKIPYAKNDNILFLANRIMIVVCVWNVVVVLVSAVKQ